MTEVDAEGAVPMIHDLTRDEQVEAHCLDVRVEVSPAKHLLKFACFDDWGAALHTGVPRLVRVRFKEVATQHFPKFLFGKGHRRTIGQLHCGSVGCSATAVHHPAAQG